MTLDIPGIQKQIEEYSDNRDRTNEMVLKLTGAIEALERQIISLEEASNPEQDDLG